MWIILAAILGLLVVVCGGCTLFAWIGVRDAGIDIAEIAQEAGRDFSAGVPATGPTSCEVVGFLGDASDTYTVEVAVTNESGIDSHYRISYDLTAPDGARIGSDFGVVSNVGGRRAGARHELRLPERQRRPLGRDLRRHRSPADSVVIRAPSSRRSPTARRPTR